MEYVYREVLIRYGRYGVLKVVLTSSKKWFSNLMSD